MVHSSGGQTGVNEGALEAAAGAECITGPKSSLMGGTKRWKEGRVLRKSEWSQSFIGS